MTDVEALPLAYATPQVAPVRPLWAAVVLAALGLGLVALSGCFMIGVGLLFDLFGVQGAHLHAWTFGTYVYVDVLYVCAGCCFGSGLWVALLSVRKLTNG